MSKSKPVGQLEQALRRVSLRLSLASFGRRAAVAMLVGAGVYLVLVLVIRGLGLLPDVLAWWHLPIVAGIAAGVVGLTFRPAGRREAARRIDVSEGTDDLFLTAVRLEGASGSYQTIVQEDAEKRAASVDAAAAAPWRWQRPAGWAMGAFLVLLASVMWLPQLDPFGVEAERQKVVRERERLQETAEATKAQKKKLERKKVDAKNSEPVQTQLTELKKQFKGFKKKDKAGALKKLGEQQQKIGKLWRERREEKLKQGDSGKSGAQRFGAGNQENKKAVQKLARKGDASAFKKRLDEIKKLADQAGKAKDPAKQRELARQIEKKLEDLARAAQQGANSAGMKAALERALEQAEMAQGGQMGEDAMEAIKDSLELAGLEAEDIAKLARDVNELEKALEAIQQAKKAAREGEGGIDGEDLPQDAALEEYAKRFQQMQQGEGQPGGQGGQPGEQGGGIAMGQGSQPGQGEGQNGGMQGSGQGQGQPGQGGTGGPGQGSGGDPGEDPSVTTGFKTEKTKSHLSAGRHLMSWKVQGVADSGEITDAYRDSVRELKAGVGEAILSEQVPPGYHETIKQYFDSMESE